MEQTAEHHTVILTDDSYTAEVKEFQGVVLVDYWAEWCPPCHVMAPRIEELAVKYAGNPHVKIAKLDVEAQAKAAMDERVMSLPTFRVFKAGAVVDEAVGAMPIENLVQLIEKNIQAA